MLIYLNDKLLGVHCFPIINWGLKKLKMKPDLINMMLYKRIRQYNVCTIVYIQTAHVLTSSIHLK